MNENYKRRMVELGHFEIKEHPKLDETYTKEMYEENIKVFKEHFDVISQITRVNLNAVKTRILDEIIRRIMNSIDYYFDIYTYKIDISKNAKFKTNFLKLRNFTKFLPGMDNENKKLIEIRLLSIQKKFMEQFKKVKELDRLYTEKSLKMEKEYVIR